MDYRGFTVAKGGPWSQAPILLQQLALLRGFDLEHLDPLGADFVHIVVECAKLAFADREAATKTLEAALVAVRESCRPPDAGGIDVEIVAAWSKPAS